jgi:hypothetical protein
VLLALVYSVFRLLLDALHPRRSVAASRAREGPRLDESGPRSGSPAVKRRRGRTRAAGRPAWSSPSLERHDRERGIAGRWPKVEAAVGPSPVVVL